MGTQPSFFNFVKERFFAKRLIWALLVAFLFGGVLFFFPNLFATQLTLDADTLTQEKIRQIFEDLKNGQGYGTLTQNIPNLTQALVSTILTSVYSNETKEPGSIEENLKKLLSSPDEFDAVLDIFVDAALEESVKYFNQFAAQTAEFKTVPERDLETVVGYLRALERILNENFNNFPITDLLNQLDQGVAQEDASLFIDAASRLQKAHSDLAVLQVPQVFAAFHAKELSLLNETWAVFDSFAAFRSDPVRVLTALNHYSVVAEKKVALQSELEDLVAQLDREFKRSQ